MYKINIYRSLALAVLMTAWLCAGACSGSSAVDNNTPPGGNVNPSSGGVTGTIVDKEGYPLGGFDTTVRVYNQAGINVAPTFNPPASGPEAGKFNIQNLPLNQVLTFDVEHVNQSVGRNLGYAQELFFSSPGVIDLGSVKLDNPWLQLGWNSYKQKDFHQSLFYFQRSLTSRKLSATSDDFTLSSSAYNGLAWVRAKRGKDNHATNPMFPGFEWDQAIIDFNKAVINFKDADAWVGKGGALMTMVADVYADPVQIGPNLPMYGYVKNLFPDAYTCFEKALAADSDYVCEHDLIRADDIRVAELFIIWLIGGTITLNEIEDFSESKDINLATMQLLSVLPDLLLYKPYPQR